MMSVMRPRDDTSDLRRLAIDELIDEIADHIGDKPEDIRDHLIACYHSNGYEFAKNLDRRFFWEPDSILVDLLDSMSTYKFHAQKEKDWVKENNITVPFEIGDKVIVRDAEAVIVKIEEDRAKIIAQPVIPDGYNYGETGGWLHNFEDAQLAPSNELEAPTGP